MPNGRKLGATRCQKHSSGVSNGGISREVPIASGSIESTPPTHSTASHQAFRGSPFKYQCQAYSMMGSGLASNLEQVHCAHMCHVSSAQVPAELFQFTL